MQKIGVIFLLLCVFVLTAIRAEEKDISISSHHAFGAELSFSQQLSLTQSPYGYPVGMGLFYQYTGSESLPILIGFDVNIYGFPPRDSAFGSSFKYLVR